MTDIVERLRKVEGGPFPAGSVGTCWYRNPDGPDAADEIDRLRAEVVQLTRERNEANVAWAEAHNKGERQCRSG